MAELFRDMEGQGRAHGVKEYSISQTTLEQVFLRLAKKQKCDDDDENHDTAESGNSALGGSEIGQGIV